MLHVIGGKSPQQTVIDDATNSPVGGSGVSDDGASFHQIQGLLIHPRCKGTTGRENSRCVSLFSSWGVPSRTGPPEYTHCSTDDGRVGE